jgi:hypothetical protein
VFLILDSVPVTIVTAPELIKPSIPPVITPSLNHKVMAREAKARKCTADVGNIQAQVKRQHRLVIFLSSHQLGTILRGTPKCV